MVYAYISHFLPKEHQKKRKTVHFSSYDISNNSAKFLATFHKDEKFSNLGCLLLKRNDEVKKSVADQELLRKNNNKGSALSSMQLGNYENLLSLPKFFDLENFPNETPLSVRYTYEDLSLVLILRKTDERIGFSMITTMDGFEVNDIQSGDLMSLCFFLH
ncbi:hypothetical protein DICVIV_00139 [Dictyocaulus viviparus]|uniref:Uncharacterized protein n=1 Tax=Dictyocaulus viviparus TaxID=29172 RepID=A0A0D8YAF4_DICVI|nr:hypothetical protein DICVIV_00139 [Dictyocaulus viviparus]